MLMVSPATQVWTKKVQKMDGWMIMVCFFVNMYKLKSKTIFSETVEASGWR